MSERFCFRDGKWLAVIGLAAAVFGAGCAEAEVDRAAARADMRVIYASLSTLLPLSVDDQAFRSPAEREKIRAALASLQKGAEHVADHVAGDDRRVRYLAEALSRETREATLRFDQERYEGAQFLVRRFTDFCVACHTRVPSAADSPLAAGFVSADTLGRLPTAQRASIQVATRRFDDALATYEALFASEVVAPAEMLAPLMEYLRVCLRVKNDVKRPRTTLMRFAVRPDLWSNLRGDVDDWIAALYRAAEKPSDSPSVERARALLAEAQRVMRYPTDRRGLVQQLLASGELHRYLEGRAGETGRDIAEAYYLLGLIETRTKLDYIVSEGDFYLETAIRLAPGDSIGQAAFDLLEEETVIGWTGSGGSHMPDDVREHLEELRGLVESAEPTSAR